MKIPVIEVNQPIGTFYLSSIKAKYLIDKYKINPRRYDSEIQEAFGIQRSLNQKRVKDIAIYTDDPDATFPTCIILSINSNDFNFKIVDGNLEFKDSDFIAEIIDGQHRIEGIKNSSNIDLFDIPVAILFDLTDEEKAYIFSTINSNQQKVDISLIYDLFTITDKRSPYKTAHEIARSLNIDSQSPYRNRLKMLGKKNEYNQTLSQGAFVNYLVPLISSNPKKDLIDEKLKRNLTDEEGLPFRYYYIRDNDPFIYKVLLNYFKAFSTVFKMEWEDNNNYIITRSTGFGAMMLALKQIASRGLFIKDLSYEFFEHVAVNLKEYLEREGKVLNSTFYPSNIQQQRILQREIENCSEF